MFFDHGFDQRRVRRLTMNSHFTVSNDNIAIVDSHSSTVLHVQDSAYPWNQLCRAPAANKGSQDLGKCWVGDNIEAMQLFKNKW